MFKICYAFNEKVIYVLLMLIKLYVCVDRLKEIQKENRQTLQGNTIHKLTSGTTRKACHKYANKNEKGSSPSKRFKASPVRIQTVADTTKYNHNGLAVYNTGRDHYLM